jgi:molybdopterin-containing oxidoreductase family iron-sulfur binding subunit
LPRFDRDGMQTDFDPAAADVILSVADDFLYAHPSSLRYTRAFAARRRMTAANPALNRLYMLEPTPTVTGTMADHRLPASPARLAVIVRAIAAALGVSDTAAPAGDELTARELEFVRHAARDLRAPGRTAVCLTGPEMDDAVHHLVAAINSRISAGSAPLRPPPRPTVRSDADPRAAGTLRELTTSLEAGDVQTLLILGCNPVYTAPADVPFAAALARAEFTLHMRPYFDETAARCAWHLPESHFLESWSDLRAYDGLASIVQPLIEPLFHTRTLAQVVHFCANPPAQSDFDLVRTTWRDLRNSDTFDADWQTWLRAGVIPDSAPVAEEDGAGATRSASASPALENASGALGTILVRADPNLLDGRWANNAWLQEIPRPLSHLVWDNAALVSPAFARRHNLQNGDVVTLRSGDRRVDAPVWIQPGQADDCVTVHLGYGRARAGTVGTGVGFNAYRLRTHASPSQLPLTDITRTGRRHELVTTQGHFQMEGRDLVRVVEAAHALEPHPPDGGGDRHLFPPWPSPNYAWAMVIDLSTCIGCNACTVACQAENNIPVVGKEQVAIGREMHWIRVDRYYAGEPADPRILQQPVPCMHCETAPCELVCPVHATVHSSEGLNDMVYNRCIGTRYCSNNCPYKVRRFNFFDYQLPREALPALQLNPDVTVRDRGVMEKCTYCVQRINAARIEASKEQRLIRDGELQTACQQVCPAEAIVFGDINTPGSVVAGRREHPLHYDLLHHLNTRPRTTYLARVVNPAGEAEGELV